MSHSDPIKDKKKARMMVNPGKPNLQITVNGLLVPLYSAGVLRRIINRDYETFLNLEKLGRFLPALFKNKDRRYYSYLELIAVQEATAKYGLPRFSQRRESEWERYVRKRWDEIRKSIKEGKEPETSIILWFGSMQSLQDTIDEILRSRGIESTPLVHYFSEKMMHRSIGQLYAPDQPG
jgi:hypothetical protein